MMFESNSVCKIIKLHRTIRKSAKSGLMKLFTILPVSLLATGTFLLSGTMSAQVYDDLYYTPGSSTSNTTTETYTTPDYGSDYGTSDSDYRVYSDDFSSEKYYDEDGNTYVVNNYYYEDDWDDYSYSMYVNRFYTPYYGFSYYSPCYDPWFWRPGWGWNVGYNSWTGWNVGWGYSWGWCSGWDGVMETHGTIHITAHGTVLMPTMDGVTAPGIIRITMVGEMPITMAITTVTGMAMPTDTTMVTTTATATATITDLVRLLLPIPEIVTTLLV